MSYQDVFGSLPQTPIGHDFDRSHPVDSFLATARGVAFHPKEFYAALPRKGDYVAPLLFALVCAEVAAILGGILSLGGSNGLALLISSIVGTAIGTAIGLFVISAVAHLLVTLIVGSTNSGFEATFRAAAYASVTSLASWIPVIGGLISLYGLYLAVVGIREVHQTTTGKAAAVVLIPVAVVAVLGILIAVAVGLAFFSGLGGLH